jgi:hypothetical protein
MSAPRPQAEQGTASRAMPQLPPWLRRPHGAVGWVGLTIGMTLASAVLLVLGLLAIVVALLAWLVRAAIWLVLTIADWVWFLCHGLTWRTYPFAMSAPIGKASRAGVTNDAWVASLPRMIGLVARTAGFLFAPIALLASLVGLVVPGLRARPYLDVFSVPNLEAKLVGLGSRHGYFDDGQVASVTTYQEFLREVHPQHAAFLDWWQDPDAPRRFEPPESTWSTPAHVAGLILGPYPDPLGIPGLALTAIRRTRVDGLRDLFISQREIDDLCDPDLDAHADVAVIRVVRVDDPGTTERAGAPDPHPGDTDARPGVRWLVQFPSTQTWHARAGRAPNDLTADFVALSMHETTLTRAAVVAMHAAGIRIGEPVLVAGFSLGGLIAAQVADLSEREGFTVTHLVTAGSPIGRYRLPDRVRVLSLEHLLDSVPRLEGRENPIVVDRDERRARRRAGEWITVKAGPPLPHGYRVSATHQSPAYAETAAAIEADPPAAEVAGYLDEIRPFFAGTQHLTDYAAVRIGVTARPPAVPVSLHATTPGGIAAEHLRTTLRRVPGVIAVDLYPSRVGFPTAVLRSADLLVRSLRPWFEEVERTSVYRGLLALLLREGGVGLHLRLQAKETPGITWEATLQQMPDGRWRELIDVGFDSDEVREEWASLLMPQGWASTVTYYDEDAFG